MENETRTTFVKTEIHYCVSTENLHTSTNPWVIRTRMTKAGLMVTAPGTKRLRNAEVAIAVPKILLAGNREAKKPPGT